MGWPGMVEYSAAVQNQRASFLVPELQSAKVVPNRLGLPKVCSGAFAIVYELKEGANTWAIRCFTKDVGDLQERYAAIAGHLKAVRLSHFVSFDYLRDGIRVGGQVYPIMKMQWVDGIPLNRYVEQHVDDAARLLALAGQFGELTADLEKQKIGHGDLSADNVLMAGHTIRLIDYDGMYVPKLAGRKARELGNPAFQHPKRNEALFGPEIDRFAALVIATALAALAADPTLWKRHGGGNGLLFSPVDLHDPKGSPLFRTLLAAPDPTVTGLASELAKWCEANPAKLGTLPPLKGLKVKRGAFQAPAAAAAAPVPGRGITVSLTAALGNGSGSRVSRAGAGAAAAVSATATAALSRVAGWLKRKKGPAAPAPKPAAAPRAVPAANAAAARVAAASAAAAKAAVAAAPAPKPAAPPPAPAAAAAVAAAARATPRSAVDWTGVVVTALAFGVFCVLFAPETRSLSMVAFPPLMALVTWGEVAAQRAAAVASPAVRRAAADQASAVVTGVAVGFFAVLFAPDTRSLSLVTLPAVLALVRAAKRVAARP